jgi:hypothetical protein
MNDTHHTCPFSFALDACAFAGVRCYIVLAATLDAAGYDVETAMLACRAARDAGLVA